MRGLVSSLPAKAGAPTNMTRPPVRQPAVAARTLGCWLLVSPVPPGVASLEAGTQTRSRPTLNLRPRIPLERPLQTGQPRTRMTALERRDAAGTARPSTGSLPSDPPDHRFILAAYPCPVPSPRA